MQLLEQFPVTDLRPSGNRFLSPNFSPNSVGTAQRTAADLTRRLSNEARATKSVLIGPSTGINLAISSIERNAFVAVAALEAEAAAILARLAAERSGHIQGSRTAAKRLRATAEAKRDAEVTKRARIEEIFLLSASEQSGRNLSTDNTRYLQSVLSAEAAELAAETAEKAAETVDAANLVRANAGRDIADESNIVFFEPPDKGVGLYFSNLLENDYTAWLKTKTYARGAYAISPATHSIYRSLKDSNRNNDPDKEIAALANPLQDDPDPVHWQRISATNLFKLFDKKPSIRSTNANVIEVFLACDSATTGLGFFNLDADEIVISVFAPNEQNCPSCNYVKTINLVDNSGVVDWLSYYTFPILTLDSYLFLDLPVLNRESLINVKIKGKDRTVGCGQIVVGDTRTVGFAEIKSTGFRGLDFSVVNVDEFGNLQTVERNASKVTNIDVVAPTSQMASVDALFRKHRGGKPIVWIPDDNPQNAAFVYGFYRDYSVVYSTGGRSFLNLEIQGVV